MTNQRLARDIAALAVADIATTGGPIPVWSIDFTQQSPASAGLTFTRASNAGYYNPQGNWVIALNDTLRLSHNPVTGQPYGFLCEESRTNYLLNSATPATQTVTLATGSYILWIEGTGNCTCSAGTAVGTGFGTANATTPIAFTLTTGGSVQFTVSGSVSRFQCENGSLETSFITTTGSAATRAADVCSKTLGSLINPAEGTFVVTGTLGNNMALGADDGAGGSSTRLHIAATTTNYGCYIIMGNVFKANHSVIEARPRTRLFKAAVHYSATGSIVATNGAVTSLSTANVNAFNITTLRIGCRFLPGAMNFLNGHITSVAYYNTAFSRQQLQQITV